MRFLLRTTPENGRTAARHTSQEFVELLTEVVERAPAREVHIILDNLSAHKSQVVRDFLPLAALKLSS
jgi:hypothetical protein